MSKINKQLFKFILERPSLLSKLLQFSNFENHPRLQNLRSKYIAKAIEGIYSAGEDLTSAEQRILELEKENKGAILNYSMESANEEGIQLMKEEYFRIIKCLEKHKLSFVALKPTALISTEQILHLSSFHKNVFYEKGEIDFESIFIRSKIEQIAKPFTELAQLAIESGTKILIDAEQSSLQPGVDLLALFLMKNNNINSANIYNTYQLYLKDSWARINSHKKWMKDHGAEFAAKIVRGAYLSYEQKVQNACHKNYQLCTNKIGVDANFNAAMLNLISQNDSSIVIATHNSESIACLKSITDHKTFPNVEYAYLMGFGDSTIERDLNVRSLEYVPYGPSDVKIPYLLRRLEENAAIFQNKR